MCLETTTTLFLAPFSRNIPSSSRVEKWARSEYNLDFVLGARGCQKLGPNLFGFKEPFAIGGAVTRNNPDKLPSRSQIEN